MTINLIKKSEIDGIFEEKSGITLMRDKNRSTWSELMKSGWHAESGHYTSPKTGQEIYFLELVKQYDADAWHSIVYQFDSNFFAEDLVGLVDELDLSKI